MAIQRTSRLTLLLSEDELERLKEQADIEGIAFSSYARSLILRAIGTVGVVPNKGKPSSPKAIDDPWAIKGIYRLCGLLAIGEKPEGWTKEEVAAARTILDTETMTRRLAVLNARWRAGDYTFDFAEGEELP